ncbi:lipoprotein [Roseomonas fluvialis]|uniref:Lipoprotein n=1 Tax=Roseomonas fluvialis TaxID=1750527 RepID=A0ABM7Y8I4_9PROT|nr:lipoprotein [Roseomonas fluvialis]
MWLHVLVGCSTAAPVTNLPLPHGVRNRHYDLADLNAASGRPDLLILVSLSGGGKRSAAFAHGVLRGMRAVPVRAGGPPSDLLAEVDQLAAVSGGSFAAAHYALHGQRSFTTFPEEFLYRDIASYVWGSYLLPWHWHGLFSPFAATNDRMAEVYDALMFRGATFSDLFARGRPRLSINATDLASGVAFPFLPRVFDAICSDLGRFPLARAVAASNGFPLLFTPITLTNHRGADCDVPLPREEPAMTATTMDDRARLRRIAQTMADRERTPWIHLLDGGIADNLAMRAMHNFTLLGGTDEPRFAAQAMPVRRILLISVDGQSTTDPAISRQPRVNSLSQIFDAASGAQIDNYNAETIAVTSGELARAVLRQRERRCRSAPMVDGKPCHDVRGLLARVSLSDVQDIDLRIRLGRIPTGLSLPRADVDTLVAAGEGTILGNRSVAAFLND